MSEAHPHPSMLARETQLSASICLQRLEDDVLASLCAKASPHGALHAINDYLAPTAAGGHAWITLPSYTEAQKAPGSQPDQAVLRRNISAWPSWLKNLAPRADKPLLYLLRSETLNGLHAALAETEGHGIFFNEAEAFPSRWVKSVQPALPLWLAIRQAALPYDPASGAETLAILRHALQALYLEDESGFFYICVHAAGGDTSPLPKQDAQDAFKGLYRVATVQEDRTVDMRLLGAGAALSHVTHAAELLRQDWGLHCEVWSCPSYTRLSREARQAAHWNMLHPLSPKKVSHLHHCLGANAHPTLAVTGYSQYIADQIREFLPKPFMALGADSCASHATLNAQWVVVSALRLLSESKAIPSSLSTLALNKYGLR